MSKDHRYDYLFIGTGNSALTAAALLTNAGKRVLMLEAHDIPGGYAQSFAWGDYFFCGQVHYIWGAEPGGRVNAFLKKVGLDKEVEFELYDPDGYDVMAMPDGKKVKIPYGWHRLIKNIEEAYPGEGSKVRKFLSLINQLRAEFRHSLQVMKVDSDELDRIRRNPKRLLQWIKEVPKLKNLIKYRNYTLQDAFDLFNLSIESQTVLAANAGDFMEPPERLSFFAYLSLFSGYNGGAFYPKKHYKHWIDSVAKFIESHRGSRIIYKSEVAQIESNDSEITGVITKDGRRFSAKNYICNMDPKKAANIIGFEKFSPAEQSALNYEYSQSGVMIYLGLKNIDLKKYGFGRHNIWHCENWDMNKMWHDQAVGNFEKPWIFISTPTLHTSEGGTCPPGHQIMEIASYTEYQPFEDKKLVDYKEYEQYKNRIAERMIEIVEQRYIPDFKKYIDVKVIGSPTSNEDWAWAPRGNAYGSTMIPSQTNRRVQMGTSFNNFYFCNATAGYAGMNGTTSNGINLYEKLTGDKFDVSVVRTDHERAEHSYELAKKQHAAADSKSENNQLRA
ncbi:NAD(P)/FAD-dependent oxidoreductase [Candidatus Berkelbacteria bacterium]|nr:NAD(P)/FAD-dependent oxidoreductase [Candidatus Berkelbacteria bacterium]